MNKGARRRGPLKLFEGMNVMGRLQLFLLLAEFSFLVSGFRPAGTFRQYQLWSNILSPRSKLSLSAARRYRISQTALSAKLWDRLEVEEDPEPFWYLLNCVAGNEVDLLRQCRVACKDMPDAVKFVVPTERKTRSHGPNRMVTETKVKYQGYVFAKLRLCAQVYEAIQGLDLCRSWMGTVNHKGYKKLPPAPVALNEMEVENFGLEECEDKEVSEEEEEENGVIVDTPDQDNNAPKVDQDALKAYLGLKVDDMIKVTARGKVFNEDGIIRRLKDGKIFVRFYTYGTMYEEWLNPTDVRKLSNMEILKGLSGPSQPVTQRDFDSPQREGNDRNFGDTRFGVDTRLNPTGAFQGNAPRNRRQDRTERNFRQNSRDRSENDESNWNWYQDQQRAGRPDDATDGSVGMSAQSRRRDGGDWAIGNVDSQWGRSPQPERQNNRNDQQRRPNQQNRQDNPPFNRQGDRQNRQDNPPFNRQGDRKYNAQYNRKDNAQYNRQDDRQFNRRAESAIEGKGDWSNFVSASPSSRGSKSGRSNSDEDDFFSSLMNELSQDKKGLEGRREEGKSAPARSDDDDFFDSLLSDLKRKGKVAESKTKTKKPQQSSADDDFFVSLEKEMNSGLSDKKNPERTKNPPRKSSSSGVDDDFFASLEAELKDDTNAASSGSSSGFSEDFFAQLLVDTPSIKPSSIKKAPVGDVSKPSSKKKAPEPEVNSVASADDDFFASLENDLDSKSLSRSYSLSSDLDDVFAVIGREQTGSGGASGGDSASFLEDLESPKSKSAKSVSSTARTGSSSSSPSSMGDLSKHTVPVLKEMLRERGLKVTGKKSELIERLKQ